MELCARISALEDRLVKKLRKKTEITIFADEVK